jgi:hypothetical protein
MIDSEAGIFSLHEKVPCAFDSGEGSYSEG